MIKIGVRVRWRQSRRHNKPQDDDQTIIHSFIWPSSVHSLIHLCQVLGNFSHNFRAHFPRHSLYVSPIVPEMVNRWEKWLDGKQQQLNWCSAFVTQLPCCIWRKLIRRRRKVIGNFLTGKYWPIYRSRKEYEISYIYIYFYFALPFDCYIFSIIRKAFLYFS